MYQKWSCSSRFSRPSCRARAGTRANAELVPAQNMWCFSVLFCVAKCESEIAKTGRRRTPKDGIGRSHRDLAIRSLGSPVNLAFALNTAVYHLEVWFCKISARSNYMPCQRWDLLKRIFISVASRARGNTCKRRTGPPQNMWCFSVLFCVAQCENEIAKTGRRRTPKDGIGRSQNTAVYAPVQNATHKSGASPEVA